MAEYTFFEPWEWGRLRFVTDGADSVTGVEWRSEDGEEMEGGRRTEGGR